MNYNDRYPNFSFRVSRSIDQKLNKLAKLHKLSKNEFARDILIKYLSNQLIEKSEDLATEKMKLQIEKLKAEIKYMEIKNNYAENFHAPMSRSATVHIKPQVIVETKKTSFEHPQSPYDATNKRLQCVDCGQLWNWYSEKEFNSQMQEFQRHLVNAHNRPSTEIERQVLIELNYEGDSTR